jgi:hypothetical protein
MKAMSNINQENLNALYDQIKGVELPIGRTVTEGELTVKVAINRHVLMCHKCVFKDKYSCSKDVMRCNWKTRWDNERVVFKQVKSKV